MATNKTFESFLKNLFKIKTINILYVLLLVALFLIGYLLAQVQNLKKGTTAQLGAQPQQQAQQQPQVPQGKVDVKNGNYPALGDSSAKVTIVEFADFQCPFCDRLQKDSFPSIKKDYIDTGKVQYYYRNYAFLGQESTWAAEAASCANEQGKFWEYHDYLFNHQGQENGGTFSKDNLKKFAADLGLDSGKFNNCLDTDKYKSAVEQDTSQGQQAGVNGTPALFVNGNIIVGAVPYTQIKAAIDKELASK